MKFIYKSLAAFLKRYCSVVIVSVASIVVSSLTQAGAVIEMRAEIQAVDTQLREVVLKQSNNVEGVRYKMAFDGKITLANGDQGVLGSVQPDDIVVLILDEKSKAILSLGVRPKKVFPKGNVGG